MISVLLFLAAPVYAQEPLMLRHTILGMEPSSTGTQLTYRLNLINSGPQNFHKLRLSFHDVSLSLTVPTDSLDFRTLSSGQQKHRSLTLHSALSSNQLETSDDLLFHLQGIDAQGQTYSILIRSREVSQ